MQRSTTTPDAYIASLPDDAREDIATLDREISVVMAGRERVLWEGTMWGGTEQRIIGYGACRHENRSGGVVEWFVIGLARQKQHLSIYVNAVEDGAYLVQAYADRLGTVKVGSAKIAVRHVADLDLSVLRDLLDRAARLTVDG